jgi:hypothetical protein
MSNVQSDITSLPAHFDPVLPFSDALVSDPMLDPDLGNQSKHHDASFASHRDLGGGEIGCSALEDGPVFSI